MPPAFASDWPHTLRAEAVSMIEAELGMDGLEAFMRTPQPDLCDMTGAELLQHDPMRLVSVLKERKRKQHPKPQPF